MSFGAAAASRPSGSALGLSALLPLGLAALNRVLAPAATASSPAAAALLLWEDTMFGVVVLHWTAVLTATLDCFIVRVMKGPAYVADAYPLPADIDQALTRR